MYGRIPLLGDRVFLSYEMSASLSHELFVYAHGWLGPPENRPVCVGTISSPQPKIDSIRALLETGHSLIGTVSGPIENVSGKILYQINFSSHPVCSLVYNIIRDNRTVDAALSDRLAWVNTWEGIRTLRSNDDEMPDVERLHLEAED